MWTRAATIALTVWLSALLLPSAEPTVNDKDLPRVPATEPGKAISTFKVRDGFRLELVASEPLIASPVAMAFDENGRLFVVEMIDYSERRDEQLGRVKLLEDRNGDGTFDHATIYAAKLPWPTAIVCYDGGVFVGASPDIVYLKDTNDDGVADVRRTVFTGFASAAPKLNVQQLLNSFTWGLDNRIHGALGGNASVVTNVANRASKPVDLRGKDFSFDPRTFDLRAETGGGQWGIAFDAAGNKFTCSNARHIVADMYPASVLGRNPFFVMPRPDADIAVDGPAAEIFRISPDEPWRVLRTKWRVAGDVSGPVEGGGRVSGYFTGVSGIGIYDGNAFPPEFRGNAFIAESGGNLVHRKKLRRQGVAFVAERPADERNREFLASTDNWFRPVALANAPDGALYIVDMYREVIEHPWALPPALKSRIDLNSGNDRGRIYRVVPTTFKQPSLPRLGDMGVAELVQILGQPNGWHRSTAARLLMERKDPETPALLHSVINASSNALARLHALHLLRSLGALSNADLTHGFDSQDPVVRSHAIRLSSVAPFDADPALLAARSKLANDPDATVRYELAFADERAEVLGRIIERDVESSWTSVAVLSGCATSAAPLLVTFAPDDKFLARTGAVDFVSRLAFVVGAANLSNEVAAALPVIAHSPAALVLAENLGAGLARAGTTLSVTQFTTFARPVFDRARATLTNTAAPEKERIASAHLLRFTSFADSGSALDSVLRLTVPPALQSAAVEALVAFHDGHGVTNILGKWDELAPSTRSRSIALLLTRTADSMALLDEVENNVVSRNQFTAADLDRLYNAREQVVRERAKALFQRDTSARSTVVAQYRAALTLKGDIGRGQTIFAERCITCHRSGNQGFAVGPDMASVAANGKEKLLTSIVDPNAEVAASFIAYTVETKQGDAFLGVVSADDGRTLTLKMPSTDAVHIPRADITVLKSSNRSLMPEGLESGLSVQQMADLLEFCINAKASK